VFAATGYLGHSRVMRIFAINATVVAIASSRTSTTIVCALLVICHKTPPAFSIEIN
jgi:hypothetical protein